MFKLNGKIVRIDQDLVIGVGDDAITHPSANLQDAAYRAALGVEDLPDEPRPDDKLFWVFDNGDGTYRVEVKTTALADLKAELIRTIDMDADGIYTAALGNRATEYAQAEAEALLFKGASYAGDVPAYVQAWATAKGKSAQWSADDILATAGAWRLAQTAIRANRLACKEATRLVVAEDDSAAALLVAVEAAEAVRANWQSFLAAIRAQLKV